MIKSSAIFSAHAIHELLRNTLIFFIVIFIALFFWLKVGIKADSLVFGKYKIEKLYIKLDKKFTLRANKIIIPKSKKKPTFDNLDETFDKIKYLFTFFDLIDLKKITFDDNKLDFTFIDNKLHISSDDYEISGTIAKVGRTLVANISRLYIKKENITINGNIRYHLRNHNLHCKGVFDAYKIQGDFIVDKKGDDIDFKVSSLPFVDLKTLIDKIPMNMLVRSWIVDKVQAQKFTLNTLEGSGTMKNNSFQIDFDTLKAKAFLEDAKIYYHKDLAPILADNIILTYKNRGLYFDLKNPVYNKRNLKNSKVAIINLGQKSILKLDLHVVTPVDDVLHKVLHAYHIKIPVKHKGKYSNAVIKIDLPLGKKHKNKKIKVKVEVDVGRGDVWYKNIKLPIKKAHVTFDNSRKENIVVAAVLKKGMVEIGKVSIPVRSGKGRYTKGLVKLENVHIKSPWYNGKVSGPINLNTKKATLKLALKKMTIGDKKKYIIIKDKVLPLELNYAKKLRISVPSLDLKIATKKETLVISLASLKTIKPYVFNLDIDFDGGSLEIIKKDTDNYTFKGMLHRNACFLYDKNSLCHTKIPCHGSITRHGLDFYVFNKRLHYNSQKSRIKLNNINIDLKKLIEARSKKRKQKGKNTKLVILGKKSTIRYDKYSLLTDSFDVEISPKGNIKASGSLNGDIVKFSKKNNKFSLEAFRIQDTMLHPLIGFDGLKEGRYTLKNSGNPDKIMKGEIIVEGGIISDFKAYNNTLALLNTIPAIATLSNPGFSEKGFQVLEGLVEYRMIKSHKIIFDSIYIKGTSATIVGKGELDIKNNTIDMDLAIQTARELGTFVGNLPLLGYILLGKDKSITIGLKIQGTLSQPIVNTSTVSDILTLPLEFIKRTLESPAHIINK